MSVRLLGPLSISFNGGPVAISSRKARALLGYLALREGTEISRSVLTGLLWGDRSESQARASLRQTLSELRAALSASDRQPIAAKKEAITWTQGAAWIDAKALFNATDSADDDELRYAADLVRGELMEGLSVDEPGFQNWLQTEREQFRLIASGIHARLMAHAEQNGRLEEALTSGLKLLSLDPLQEHVHRALMRIYAAQRRYDAALAQYERCKRELLSQLGVTPEPETEQLALSIRKVRRTGPAKPRDAQPKDAEPDLPLPEKPSIAVLPFQSMSGDPEQEYFADGIVDEIITALSRFRNLFVISRNSSFTYKGRAVDVKRIGRELGVRYLLEGSVRKAGGRIRITGQLVDALSGAHLWADRFDGELTDVFNLQDQAATSVVGAIAPRVEEAEIGRAKRKPTENLDAYDYYLRGLAMTNQMTRTASDEALQLFNEAIQRDSGFALAHARAAYCYQHRKANSWMVDRGSEVAVAGRLARRAIELGRDDAVALSYGGHVLGYVAGELDDGAAFVDRALALNSNLAAAWTASGWMKICFGEPDVAIEHVERAVRLSPVDPRLFTSKFLIALAHYCAGRFEEAASWAEDSVRDQPTFASALRIVAGSKALGGRTAEAEKAMARLRALYPELRASNLDEVMVPFRRPEDRARYVKGLRKAGLPD